MVNFLQNFAAQLRGVASRFKNNAVTVPRSRQYSGESSIDLPFSRFYEYFHGWPEVKRGLNGIHRRLVGTDISFESDDEVFTELFNVWAKMVRLKSKMKESIRDCLITGTLFMEKQYTSDKKLGSVKHIPTKSIWKIFRDDFGNDLEIVQLVEGQFIRLSPDWMIKYTINNPEEEALGKSEIFSIAVPQKVTGKADIDGNIIEPDKYLVSVLDRDARIKFAQMATAEKHAKARMFVTLQGENDRERQKEIEKDLNNDSVEKWIALSDKKWEVAKAEVDISKSISDLTSDMKSSITKATGFPGNVIDEPGTMGFASSQTPIQEVMAQIAEMQKDLEEIYVEQVMKVKAEEWGFDPDKTNPSVKFNAFVEKVTLEQLTKIPESWIAPEEAHEVLKEFIPGLDDEIFKKFMEQKKKLAETAKAGPGVDESRPDIEKEAPKPETTSAENHPVLRNPKVLENFIALKMKQIKARENFGTQLFSLRRQKFETEPPAITEEVIEELLKEVDRDKLTNEEAIEAATFAGFNSKLECIVANVNTEIDPGHYCEMFKNKKKSGETDIVDNTPASRSGGQKRKKIVKSVDKDYEANTFGDLNNEINPTEIKTTKKVDTTDQDAANIPTISEGKVLKKKASRKKKPKKKADIAK